MKRILYLYHVSSIGGGSYCLLNLLMSIDRRKYLPIVLLCAEGPLCNEIRKLGIEVHTLPSLRTVPYNSTLFNAKTLLSLISLQKSKKSFRHILLKFRPDLLYVNTMMMYPYLRVAKKLGIKTCIHIREHWPENEHTWQRNRAITHIKRDADQLIAINRYSASMFNDITCRCTIVYDWIDMDNRYEPLPINNVMEEDCSNLKVYLYTGGLQTIKGLKEIVETFTQNIKGDEKRLLLMGVNPKVSVYEGMSGKLKKLLSLFGYKTYSQKVFEMIAKDSRIKCISSTYKITHLMQQVYGMVSYFTIPHANLALAEGVIVGTPSIAARTDESVEYSNNETLACLYTLNRIDEFIEAWKDFDNIRPSLVKLIETDSPQIKNLFEPHRNIALLDSVYSKILLS